MIALVGLRRLRHARQVTGIAPCVGWRRCGRFRGAARVAPCAHETEKLNLPFSLKNTSYGYTPLHVRSWRSPRSSTGTGDTPRALCAGCSSMSRQERKLARQGWSQSIAFRMMARAAIRAHNARRHLLPKCGAKARSSGQPCRQIAMANGRCAYHGGKVPRGDQWHRVQWSDDQTKFAKKLARQEKRARQKAESDSARMTAGERAEHDNWQRTHRPGDPEAARHRSRETPPGQRGG